MTVQRRVARGAQTRPGPRRRSPQSHDKVRNPARARHHRQRAEARQRAKAKAKANRPPLKQRLLRGATKTLGQLVVVLAILAVFVFFVFPTGSYVEQRNDLQEAEAQLAELQEENAVLEARIERLGSEVEIEREAREFGLVRPEEENYLIIAPGN